jgi:hypothetical protein
MVCPLIKRKRGKLNKMIKHKGLNLVDSDAAIMRAKQEAALAKKQAEAASGASAKK